MIMDNGNDLFLKPQKVNMLESYVKYQRNVTLTVNEFSKPVCERAHVCMSGSMFV